MSLLQIILPNQDGMMIWQHLKSQLLPMACVEITNLPMDMDLTTQKKVLTVSSIISELCDILLVCIEDFSLPYNPWYIALFICCFSQLSEIHILLLLLSSYVFLLIIYTAENAQTEVSKLVSAKRSTS